MEKRVIKEKIILGVDPGTNVTGYGLLFIRNNKPSLLQYGVVHLSSYNSHPLKLKKIFEKITQLIKEYHPDEMALEAPFYGKNVQSMLKLGRAQGVAMSAALALDIPIVEYAPKKVKQSVTGNGNATKEQVAAMIMNILQFKADNNSMLDATDALGVALCHFYQNGSNNKKTKSWKAFLTENPNRVKK